MKNYMKSLVDGCMCLLKLAQIKNSPFFTVEDITPVQFFIPKDKDI